MTAFERIIEALDFPRDERVRLAVWIDRIPTRHRARGMLLQGNADALRATLSATAADEFERFQRPYRPRNGFELRPFAEVSLVNAKLASLRAPGATYAEGISRDAQLWLRHAESNVFAQMIRAGIEPNLADFLCLQTTTMSRLFDFGEYWAEKARRSVRFFMTGCHAPLMVPMVEGATRGILDFVDVPGSVVATWDPEHDEGEVVCSW